MAKAAMFAVKAEPETEPEAEVSDVATKYLVRSTFTVTSPVTMTFKQGGIVDASPTILQLIEAGAPFDPIQNESELMTCPHCQRAFFKPKE